MEVFEQTPAGLGWQRKKIVLPSRNNNYNNIYYNYYYLFNKGEKNISITVKSLVIRCPDCPVIIKLYTILINSQNFL